MTVTISCYFCVSNTNHGWSDAKKTLPVKTPNITPYLPQFLSQPDFQSMPCDPE